MPDKYRIILTADERQELNDLINSKRIISAKKILKARAILLTDESELGCSYTDSKISEALGITPLTIARLRKRVCEVGPMDALNPKKRSHPPRDIVIDGVAEAELVKIACSEAPEGYNRWTLRLLAERMVELKIVDSVSHETVRNTLKKTKLSLG